MLWITFFIFIKTIFDYHLKKIVFTFINYKFVKIAKRLKDKTTTKNVKNFFLKLFLLSSLTLLSKIFTSVVLIRLFEYAVLMLGSLSISRLFKNVFFTRLI